MVPGNLIFSLQDVRTLLAPLALSEVKTVRCLGLNYAQHAKEVLLPVFEFSTDIFITDGDVDHKL